VVDGKQHTEVKKLKGINTAATKVRKDNASVRCACCTSVSSMLQLVAVPKSPKSCRVVSILPVILDVRIILFFPWNLIFLLTP